MASAPHDPRQATGAWAWQPSRHYTCSCKKGSSENRRCAVMGGVPLAEKRAAKVKAAPLTFKECVTLYADVKLDEFSNKKHRREWVRSIERLAFPVLADMPVRDIGARGL